MFAVRRKLVYKEIEFLNMAKLHASGNLELKQCLYDTKYRQRSLKIYYGFDSK